MILVSKLEDEGGERRRRKNTVKPHCSVVE